MAGFSDKISFEMEESYMPKPALKSQKKELPEKKYVLTKALIRSSEMLKLSRQELSAIIGLSESSLSRLFHDNHTCLNPKSKEGQLGILLIRLYQSLDSLLGGNSTQCELWLRSENIHLGETPIKLIKSIEGLILTLQYLDAMRGKN